MLPCSDEAKSLTLAFPDAVGASTLLIHFWPNVEQQILHESKKAVDTNSIFTVNCIHCEYSVTPRLAELFRSVALFSQKYDLYSGVTYI